MSVHNVLLTLDDEQYEKLLLLKKEDKSTWVELIMKLVENNNKK